MMPQFDTGYPQTKIKSISCSYWFQTVAAEPFSSLFGIYSVGRELKVVAIGAILSVISSQSHRHMTWVLHDIAPPFWSVVEDMSGVMNDSHTTYYWCTEEADCTDKVARIGEGRWREKSFRNETAQRKGRLDECLHKSRRRIGTILISAKSALSRTAQALRCTISRVLHLLLISGRWTGSDGTQGGRWSDGQNRVGKWSPTSVVELGQKITRGRKGLRWRDSARSARVARRRGSREEVSQ